MRLYGAYVVQTGDELCVAARTADHAAEIFVTFHIARTGAVPGEFQIGSRAPAAYEGHPVTDAVAQGDVAGVIVRQTDGSMSFDPAIGG
jgi:hypothetical protein